MAGEASLSSFVSLVVFAASVMVPEDEDVEAEVEDEDGRARTGRQEMGMSDGSESRQSGTMRMSEERTEAKSRFWGWSTVCVNTDSQLFEEMTGEERMRGRTKPKRTVDLKRPVQTHDIILPIMVVPNLSTHKPDH